MKDVSNVTKDLKRWYGKLNGVFHKSGLSNAFKKVGSKATTRKNNMGEKASKKYQELCKWLRNEMKK